MENVLSAFRPTMDAVSASVAIIDEQGFIIAVNKAWRDFAEANHPSPESVCEAANYLGVCDAVEGAEKAQAKQFAASLRSLIKGERSYFILEYPCHSPGEERWFSARVVPFSDGSRARAIIAHENITERIQAELALRESEKKYRELFEKSPIGISETTFDGQLLRANTAFARLYGYGSLEEATREIENIGQLYWDPEDRKEVRRILAKSGNMEPRELRARHRDGFPLITLISAREIRNEAGGLQGYQADHIDISAQKRAEAELGASREQMRALASQAQAAIEMERTSIAREIHDRLSQTLNRLKIDLVWLRGRIEGSEQVPTVRELGSRIADMIGMADETVTAVQRIATELRPAVLDSLGLGAALQWLAWDFQKHSEIECRAFVPEAEMNIDRDVSTAAFRIAQESLTNAVRHSRAAKVEINLAKEGEWLVLGISDDGIGIESRKTEDPFSLGIAGMRERAHFLGGNLAIRNGTRSGTTVEARFPLLQSNRVQRGTS